MGSLAETRPEPTLAATSRQVSHAAWTLLRSAGDLVFPPVCVACQGVMVEKADRILICDRCRQQFLDPRTSCRFCGAGIGEAIDPAQRCPHCRRDHFRFTTVVRLGSYDGPLHQAILAAKQSLHSALAIHLGRLLAAERTTELQSLQCDAVVAVPAHWTRQSKHGHNSAEVIGRQVATRLDLPYADRLLKRIRATRPQTELSPRERQANVKAAFMVQPHPDLIDARILLVDDVLTTGATAQEVSRSLLAAGAAAVAVAVLARAVGDQ